MLPTKVDCHTRSNEDDEVWDEMKRSTVEYIHRSKVLSHILATQAKAFREFQGSCFSSQGVGGQDARSDK